MLDDTKFGMSGIAAKIRCKVADLRPAAVSAASIVERRNTIPVLGNLMLTPLGDKLAIEGTNLDAWLRVECPASAAEGVPFTLRADLLVQILRGAEADEDVTISLDQDLLTFEVGPIKISKRSLIPAIDFPEAKKLKDATTIEIGEAVLASMIDNVRFAVSTEETRYYLNGIYLHPVDGKLASVATDGHKLALYRSEAEWPLPAVIVPRTIIPVLRRFLSDSGNKGVNCAGAADGTLMVFSGDGWTLTAKMIDGTFPNYPRVIPDRLREPGYAVLSRAGLRRVPVSGFGERYKAVSLDLERKRLVVKDRCEGVEVEMPIEAEGNFSIGFNFAYLIEMARRFGTIRIEAGNAGDGAHVLTEDPNLTLVIMPMRV